MYLKCVCEHIHTHSKGGLLHLLKEHADMSLCLRFCMIGIFSKIRRCYCCLCSHVKILPTSAANLCVDSMKIARVKPRLIREFLWMQIRPLPSINTHRMCLWCALLWLRRQAGITKAHEILQIHASSHNRAGCRTIKPNTVYLIHRSKKNYSVLTC